MLDLNSNCCVYCVYNLVPCVWLEVRTFQKLILHSSMFGESKLHYIYTKKTRARSSHEVKVVFISMVYCNFVGVSIRFKYEFSVSLSP